MQQSKHIDGVYSKATKILNLKLSSNVSGYSTDHKAFTLV